MIGNAHLDPVWLWPWQEGYQEARATFWSAIQRMDEYPDFVFTCDQVVLLSWVEESDPELFSRIRERIVEGRWVMVGGWWVEPDCNLPTGESFVRQGLYGQRYLKEKFGVTATVGMNADPFGHHAMLPAILRGQGMDSYCFLRPGPHESELPGTLFWWEAPDGSRVLAYRIPFEYCSPPGDVAGQTEKSLGQLDRSLDELMVFYGVGNHGGGPTRANIDSIHRYDAMGSFGELRLSSPRRYFDEVAKRVNLAALQVWRDDLQHHAAGCYSAHSGVKAWQRRAQAAVVSAERWAAIAGFDARAQLEGAWKQVLFNQFHDVLPGSAIESAYDDARDQLGEAVSVSKRIVARAHNMIARDVMVPFEEGTQPVIVFNPHPWPVTANLEMQYGAAPAGMHVVDAAGVEQPAQQVQSAATTDDRGRGATVFTAELPALGYRLFRMRPGAPATASTLTATRHLLENDLLRLELDPETGWLSRLVDKRTGADLAGAGEHTQICADPTDTWGHRVISYAWAGEAMRTTGITLVEDGPVRARIRVEREWGRSTMTEEFILGADSDEVEVRVHLDWRERAHLMKLRFPVAVDDPVATYEIPFGHLERPIDGAEEPAQSWVDVSGTGAGLAVVSAGKHGYDVSPGPSIGMTAVRSPVYAWHDPRRLDHDGHYSFQDQGAQRFTHLLVPHAGDWRAADLTRRAAVLGSPPRAMQEGSHDGHLPATCSYVCDGGGQVMVTAVKCHEDAPDDLVVRAVETTGRAGALVLDLPLGGVRLHADFGPSQIRTFRIPLAHPLAAVETDLIEVDLPGRRFHVEMR